MKKKDLEILLQRVKPFQSPKADLEQYVTPATIAADVLYSAYVQGDIADKKVLDLGCGTGMLAIGAWMLGAKEVVGVDIDGPALQVAEQNAHELASEVRLLQMNVQELQERADTVIMNPPFGAQRRHADRPFLEKALELASVSYSLHLAETQEFVESLLRSHNVVGEVQKRYKFEIPHTFAFHKKARKDVEVILFRVQTSQH
jgi:putative methylase